MKKPFNVKKFYRRTFLVIYDIISVILASYLALMIRYGFSLAEIPEHFMEPITSFLPFSIVITLIVLYIFRMYNSLWAYAGETELQNLICACIIVVRDKRLKLSYKSLSFSGIRGLILNFAEFRKYFHHIFCCFFYHFT